MLRRLHQLADDGKSFAYETTGASKSFAPWIKKLKSLGYEFHLFFFYLDNADVAVLRVADRVTRGGHHVPEETIRRRYDRGLENFFRLYCPLATTWKLINNNAVATPMPIAHGGEGLETVQHDVMLWESLKVRYGK